MSHSRKLTQSQYRCLYFFHDNFAEIFTPISVAFRGDFADISPAFSRIFHRQFRVKCRRRNPTPPYSSRHPRTIYFVHAQRGYEIIAFGDLFGLIWCQPKEIPESVARNHAKAWTGNAVRG